ncbi:MAG TPA: flagellar M-ring protein FliF C-terminal domain-containing protein, partial [Pirellulaceae bacterium]|nr:flagellar M-ring protein FliF C-terminal domain-containing protein [Pirellulaceae bacterium]
EFDPEKRVATSETIDSSTTTGESNAGGDAASVSTSAGSGSRNTKSLLTKTEVINNKYEVSSTHREDIVRTPVLNKLTVSVLVNSSKVANDNQEIPASVKSSIESLVKQAVGYRDSVDQFNLEFFEFVELLPVEGAPAAFPWEQINSIVKNLSLGMAALVAVYLGLRTIRSLQPSPRPTPITPAASESRDVRMAQIGEMIRQNPEVFSRVLAAWANDSPSSSSPAQTKKAA